MLPWENLLTDPANPATPALTIKSEFFIIIILIIFTINIIVLDIIVVSVITCVAVIIANIVGLH